MRQPCLHILFSTNKFSPILLFFNYSSSCCLCNVRRVKFGRALMGSAVVFSALTLTDVWNKGTYETQSLCHGSPKHISILLYQ